MFELINDTFVYREKVGTNSVETIVEGEVYISEEMPNIEKIISANGKAKVKNIAVTTNKASVYGDLNFNIVYRSDGEEINTFGTSGNIDFMEDLEIQGAKEKMDGNSDIYIDYISAEIISERKIQIRAVIKIDAEVTNKQSIEYISDVSNVSDFQIKTKNIKYTEVASSDISTVYLNDFIELDMNMDEISNVLRVDANAYIVETDIMSERMLIEGMCKIGVLYVEDNKFSSINYTAKEFPFTHYSEIKNSSEDMLRKISTELSNIEFEIDKNEDLENKIINIKADFNICSKIYKDTEKSVVTDGYSTISSIELLRNNVIVESIDEIKTVNTEYEKTFDVVDGSVKDVYTVDIVPKISEKRVFNDKLVIEGFLDTELIYLNGDIDKIDGMRTNLPFSVSVNLTEEQQKNEFDVDINVYKFSGYRKNMSTVLVNAEIVSEITYKSKKEFMVINNVNDLGSIDSKEMPSLVFRVVQPGETLWDIAKNYNVSMNYLMKLNEIESESDVLVGDKILIEREL